MKFIFTAMMAIGPSLLLLWYFYKRDLHPEPRGVLIFELTWTQRIVQRLRREQIRDAAVQPEGEKE